MKSEKESYSEYADRFIEENIQGAYDWTLFNSEPFIMDGNSGTQKLMKHYGTNHGVVGLNTLS